MCIECTKINLDFSYFHRTDTSGSLNVCTPLSGKDFTREFTSRIHERCQLPVHAQQTKTILDPNSGKITTIISTPPIAIDDVSSPQATPPAKKPSYLNLACCVNGYSNLTTYDSKFRQSINKSREVSPIRPITHTVHYNRGESNYLVVPVSIPINDHNKTTSMMDAHTILSPEKRFYAQQTQQQKTHEITSTSGRDITDNINSNGCTTYFKKTILASSTTTTLTTSGGHTTTGTDSAKSFIQQRVERLYGPGALAQGLYSPKKPKQHDENGGSVSLASILVEKSQNSSKFNGYATNAFATNGSSVTTTRTSDVENVNLDASTEAPLPVLRHLRPEFRAQLPMLSPKRTTPVKVTNGDTMTTTATSNGKAECQNGIDVSPSNGVGSNSYCSGSSSCSSIVAKPMTNGCINTNAKHRLSNADDDDENSLTSTKCDTEHNNEYCHTVKNGSSSSGGGGDSSVSSSISSQNTSVTELLNSMNKMRLNDVDRSHSESSNGQSTSMAAASQSIAAPIKRAPVVDVASPTKTAIKIIESDANGNHKTETHTKDALDFLAIVHSERDRLIAMAVEIEKELDELLKVRRWLCHWLQCILHSLSLRFPPQRDDIEEDVLGHLRSGAGKARLLATQKFKQFEGTWCFSRVFQLKTELTISTSLSGLCNNCLNQVSGDSFPPPTPGDLQGFWDMVMLQVNHVDSLYAELAAYKANNWKVSVDCRQVKFAPESQYNFISPYSRIRNQRKKNQKRPRKERK